METSKIKSIKHIGTFPTMDLEINNESHTFFGNGLATSNSHSVEYSVISYWDGWLKYYYPKQFYASYLTYASDDKKFELMNSIQHNNEEIYIEFPKVGISKATKWQVDGNKLVMPFSEIIGIGETSAIQIEESSKKKRRGFFGNQVLSVPAKVLKILQDIKAFDPKYEVKDEDLDELQKYFIYDLVALQIF